MDFVFRRLLLLFQQQNASLFDCDIDLSEYVDIGDCIWIEREMSFSPQAPVYPPKRPG